MPPIVLFSARRRTNNEVPLIFLQQDKGEEGAWWEGAGKRELGRDRTKDYEEVGDILRTGRRRKRPPQVTMDVSGTELAAALHVAQRAVVTV